jgi:hypothetical protein
MFVCMVQTAPVHKKFLGYQWETHSFWTLGVDRYWLGFVQDTTYRIFEWHPPRAKQPPGPTVFDRNSDFILRYHNFRPFGEPDQTMPGIAKPAGAAPAGGAQPGAAAGDPGGGRPVTNPAGIAMPGQ